MAAVTSSAGKKLSMASSAMVTSSGEPKTVIVEKNRSSVPSSRRNCIGSTAARLVDPLLDAKGPDGIAVAISELRNQMPGHSLTRTTTVDVHHDQARFAWTVNAPDGSVAVA